MLCPKCFKELNKVNKSYVCVNNHTYDISKEGYVNLLLSKTNAGDNKELIDGRINFLNKNYYKPLSNEIISILDNKFKNNPFSLCDCGCGIGYYSKNLKTYFKKIDLYGCDISKDAIKYAAKHDNNSLYIVSSNQKIPFENNFFDCLIHIFSPIFEEEAKRILKNEGILILVTPGKEHLYELKQMLYSNPYYNKVEEQNFVNFIKTDEINLKYSININLEDFHNLIKMTPYYYKTKKEDIFKVNFKEQITITIDFIISLYNPIFEEPKI